MNFHDAFNFLCNHQIFNTRFLEGLDVMVVKVNPENNRVDDDKTKNTKTRVWLETGPYIFDDPLGCKWSHDLDLDCGGDNNEEAIIKPAKLVEKKYGRY